MFYSNMKIPQVPECFNLADARTVFLPTPDGTVPESSGDFGMQSHTVLPKHRVFR
jgi:hypothetical protein